MDVSDVKKKISYSAMQPTGLPHLGNYLGALKNWVSLQDEYRCIYCIANLHSITVRQDPVNLRKRTRDLFMLYLAMGIDPKRSLLYFQSAVPPHAELAWILNCYTYMGELGRMTQYKDKSQKHSDNINAGLFSYPVLMSADILLYSSDVVPIGEDQRQHLEICRDIASRFNNIYGDVFVVPEAYIGKIAARVMGLQEPEKKMSKSDGDNENNLVYLLDKPEVIISKFKRAVTDSGNEIKYAPDKPGISNLLSIYCAVTGEKPEAAESKFAGKGYGDFKLIVGETVAESVRPIQQKFNELSKNKDYVDALIRSNTEQTNALAQRMLTKVKKKVGFPIV
ncbi:MAG: tryptophan--tRNA ligase [Clostridiales bacterium]|jgi:tryptophanyl-tRNA synthetase|nr:tryptophan--tRNA ligase [Clostridiales bacterium]